MRSNHNWLSIWVSTLVAASFFASPVVSASELDTDQPFSPRIVLGEDVTNAAEDYPWMAALLRASESDSLQAQFCGGALISPDTILTAAHCVHSDDADDVEVALGHTALSSISTLDRLEIASILIHPDYNDDTLANDVAILRLKETVGVTPIALIPPRARQNAGTNVRAIGYGAVDWDSDYYQDEFYYIFSDRLQFADLKIRASANSSSCLAWDRSSYNRIQMLCAGSDRQTAWGFADSCVGDSGGPLLMQSNGAWTVAGIVSWGLSACGISNQHPGVYTRVSSYLGWIQAAVNRISSFSPSKGAPGSTFSLSGAFDEDVVGVFFQGVSEGDWVSADIVSESLSQIQVLVPTTARSGSVKVVTSGGEFLSQGSYTVAYPRPKITSFDSSGPAGSEITIRGTGFLGASQVLFGGVDSVEFEVNSSGTQIQAMVPPGANSGRISVINPASRVTSRSNFTVLLQPDEVAITGLSSTRITMQRSRQLTISGQNLTEVTHIGFVGLVPLPLSDFDFISSPDGQALTGEIPVGALSGKITLYSEDNVDSPIAVSQSSLTIRYPRISIGTFNPTEAEIGSQVSITGRNLQFVTDVLINGLGVNFEIVSPTLLLVEVPPSASSGRVTMRTPTGSFTSRASLRITQGVPLLSTQP